MPDCPINLDLFPKQMVAFKTYATEVLFGGAAGGGKSHLMRVLSILWCTEIPGIQIFLFRRLHDDLIKTHLDSVSGFRNMLAPWVEQGLVTIKDDVVKFTFNGARIYLCHCQHEKDVGKYLSTEMHVLLIDELTTFTEKMYRQLRGRVRLAGVTIPKKYEGMFPRIMCSSNPGNIGHHFVKNTFIDGKEPLAIYETEPSEGGFIRQYIPAKLSDNPILNADGKYENNLRGLGSEALVKAMLDGDWNVVEGAFFDCWDSDRHVIEPFGIPDHWIKFRSFDWGSAKPFSCGWYAVVGDTGVYGGVTLPRGCLIKYREWYGMIEGKPNVGLKMIAKDVGKGIKYRERNDIIKYGVIDPACFTADGGPSIVETMFTTSKLVWMRADNKRVARKGAQGGWDQLRQRLKGDEGMPMIVFFKNCVHTIRTLPALQHDSSNAEDVDTNMEDHAPDETRYACMSRPWIISAEPTIADITQPATIDQLLKDVKRKARDMR